MISLWIRFVAEKTVQILKNIYIKDICVSTGPLVSSMMCQLCLSCHVQLYIWVVQHLYVHTIDYDSKKDIYDKIFIHPLGGKMREIFPAVKWISQRMRNLQYFLLFHFDTFEQFQTSRILDLECMKLEFILSLSWSDGMNLWWEEDN